MQNDNPNDTAPRELPAPGKLNSSELRTFVDNRINYSSPLRMEEVSNLRRAELYDKGWQWLNRAYTASDSAGAASWAAKSFERNDPLAIPMPVFNEGLPLRQNESARLARPEYTPSVPPTGANPDIRTRLGAKKAERVLKSELKRMGWPYQQDLGFYHMPLYGNWRLVSGWDMPWDETVMVPVEAHACPRHPVFGDRYPPAPVPKLRQAAEVLGIVAPQPPPQPCTYVQAGPLHAGTPDGQEMAHDTCPTCPDQPQMVPFQPTLEEAKSGKDSLGQPMGKAQPLGRGFLRTVTGYDVFVVDSGVDQSYEDAAEFVWTHVETLDWVAMRYPDKIRDDAGNLLIKPENPAKLSEHHPIAGMPMFYGAGATMRLFENKVRVKEYHRKPWMAWDDDKKQYAMNKGRSVIIAGDVCLLDGDYLIPSQNNPEEYLERCILTLPPWEFMDGGRRTTGLSMWQMMFDPQDFINQSQSQTQATIQTCAVPMMIASKAMNLETPENSVGLPGRYVTYDSDPVSPTLEPHLINNMTIAPGVAQAMQAAYEYMTRGAHTAEVEQGIPGGVSAATAISYLLNETGETRKPRIHRIQEALRRVWSHQLRLIAALWIEARPYQYAGEDGEEAWGALHGLDLCGQTQAEVEITSEEDTPEMKREKTRDLITLGVIRLGTDPNVDRIVAKDLGAPEALYVDTDLQESAAQRQWHYFLEQSRIPQVDPTTDDGQSHWTEHGRAWHTEEMRDLRDKGNWDGALHFLSSDYGKQLDQIAFQCANPAPVAASPEMLQQLPPQEQAAIQAGQMPPPMMPGPPSPPLQDMIYGYWMQRLMQAGFLPAPGAMAPQPQPGVPPQPTCPDPASLNKVLWWRAHMEADRLQGELKQLEAQGSPTMAAPGTDQGQAGQAMQGQAPAPPPPPQQPQVAA